MLMLMQWNGMVGGVKRCETVLSVLSVTPSFQSKKKKLKNKKIKKQKINKKKETKRDKRNEKTDSEKQHEHVLSMVHLSIIIVDEQQRGIGGSLNTLTLGILAVIVWVIGFSTFTYIHLQIISFKENQPNPHLKTNILFNIENRLELYNWLLNYHPTEETWKPPPDYLLNPLCSFYLKLFPHEVVGIENIPNDRKKLLFVCNHQQLPLEFFVILPFLYMKKSLYVRGLAHSIISCIPILKHYIYYFGSFVGTRENTTKVMKKGDPILVYPGFSFVF
jgi:hypothetical protein